LTTTLSGNDITFRGRLRAFALTVNNNTTSGNAGITTFGGAVGITR
jgi:hypothetical protein